MHLQLISVIRTLIIMLLIMILLLLVMNSSAAILLTSAIAISATATFAFKSLSSNEPVKLFLPEEMAPPSENNDLTAEEEKKLQEILKQKNSSELIIADLRKNNERRKHLIETINECFDCVEQEKIRPEEAILMFKMYDDKFHQQKTVGGSTFFISKENYFKLIKQDIPHPLTREPFHNSENYKKTNKRNIEKIVNTSYFWHPLQPNAPTQTYEINKLNDDIRTTLQKL